MSWENILHILPLLAHVLSPTDEIARLANQYVSYGVAIMLHLMIYIHFYLLSQQYYAQNPHKNYWYIQKKESQNELDDTKKNK